MMRNGQQLMQRIVPDTEPCPGCGYVARMIRQTAEPPVAGLVGRVLGQVDAGAVVESKARMKELWALCFHCLRRERWGWEGETWKLLEVRELVGPRGLQRHDVVSIRLEGV